MPGVAVLRHRLAEIAQPGDEAAVGKVEDVGLVDVFEDHPDHAFEGRAVPRHLFLGCEPHLADAPLQLCRIAPEAGLHHPRIGAAGFFRNGSRRAEIEQHHAARFGLPAVVGKVRIGLHEAEFEQFAQHQIEHRAHHPVAHILRRISQRVDGPRRDEVHRQHARPGQFVHRRGHHELRLARQHRAIAAHLLGLAQVICFLVQLQLRLSEQRRDVERLGQEARHAQQGRHVVDIGIDARRDAGILHLHRHRAPIVQHRAMDLPDRRRRNRCRLEAGEASPPVRPPRGGQHRLQLPGRHEMRCIAQPREDRGQFLWQQIARIERDHLP